MSPRNCFHWRGAFGLISKWNLLLGYSKEWDPLQRNEQLFWAQLPQFSGIITWLFLGRVTDVAHHPDLCR